MANLSILAGATSQSILVKLLTTGGGAQTGLVFNSLGLTCYYSFAGSNSGSHVITLATQTTGGAWSSGGFVEIDATNMPGIYRFDIPNASIAASKGRQSVIVFNGFLNMAPDFEEIELTGWDNQITPGATGGMFIAGTNAATAITSTVSGTAGLSITGSGAGAGMAIIAGTTGAGMTVTGGATSGDGMTISSTSGNGIATSAGGTNFAGLRATGGSGTTCDGIRANGGTTSGNGIVAQGTTLGHGVNIVAVGLNKHGVLSSGSGSGTSHALSLVAGTNAGNGISITTSSGDGINIAPTTGHGINSTGNGTTKHGALFAGGATSSDGIRFTGGGSGAGINSIGGTTGDGIDATAGATSGVGLNVTSGTSGNAATFSANGGSGAGISIIGSNSGNGALNILQTASGSSDGIKVSTSGTTGNGINVIGGGPGMTITGAAKSAGLVLTGGNAVSTNPAGAGLTITGGTATTSAGGVAKPGIIITGGAGAASTNGAESGATITGGGTNTVSSVADGLKLTGTSNGSGLDCILAGTGASITASTITGTLSTLTTYTGNTVQTGDSFVIVKSGGTGDNAAIKAKTDTIPTSPASTTNITAGTITTVTNLTNAPTAGDFTAAMKTSLNASTPASITGAVGSVTGNVGGNVVGSVGSVVGLTASNLDTTVSSRMATYTQPTGFLAATFPSGTIANTTNITAGTITTTTNLTNAATNGDLTATMKTSVQTASDAAITANATIIEIESETDTIVAALPANFSSLGITAGGHIINVDTLTTYTGNTLQTGDSFARLGAPAGASVSADIAEIEAETDALLTGVIVTTNNDKTGYTLTGAYDFAKGTVSMTESYAAVNAALSPVQALYQIVQQAGEASVSGTTETVKKRDQSTTAKTFTINDATNPTAITETT